MKIDRFKLRITLKSCFKTFKFFNQIYYFKSLKFKFYEHMQVFIDTLIQKQVSKQQLTIYFCERMSLPS